MIKFLGNIIDEDKSKSDASITMLGLLLFFPIITIIVITFLAVSFSSNYTGFIITNTLVVIFSISIVGFLVGFIFGIPRSIRFRFDKTKNKLSNSEDSESYFADNTNLEEISDWITKIIVGLTLIQWRTILYYLENSAKTIANSYPKSHLNLYVFSYSLIVFFSGLGFFGGYFWARTLFGSILIQSKNEEQEKLKLLLNRNLSNAIETNESTKGLGLTESIPTLSILKEKISNLLRVTPIIHHDDTQKERWGGNPAQNYRALKANVTPTSISGLFDVVIEVVSTSLDIPLVHTVVILLDSTFVEKEVYLTPVNNSVRVTVVAYEAFTIAAICDNLETKLELDLQKVKGLPQKFYYKN
jgi:uncharacterized integral membrane protein